MAKRNQVTTELRISADAQLKNSRSFLTQLDKIIDKFDFGNKINNQLLDAKNQLKNYNKILEKVHSKSIISDDELKDLVKAGKEIANIVTKTEKLYTNMSSSELQKFSKEYINLPFSKNKEAVSYACFKYPPVLSRKSNIIFCMPLFFKSLIALFTSDVDFSAKTLN